MAPPSLYSERENPMLIARASGAFYLLQFAFGPAMLALRKVYVPTDAAQTAFNISAHETLFRLGFAGNLIAVASYIVVTALFYALFKAVSRNLSFVAACLSLTGCAVLAASCIFYYGPLAVLNGVSSPGTATVAQQDFALMLIKLYGTGYNTSLVFFAFYGLLVGYLVFKSSFLPKLLGVGMSVSGFGWLTFLWPSFAIPHFPFILLTGLGEAVLAIWLLLRGVNSERWHEQSAAARLDGG